MQKVLKTPAAAQPRHRVSRERLPSSPMSQWCQPASCGPGQKQVGWREGNMALCVLVRPPQLLTFLEPEEAVTSGCSSTCVIHNRVQLLLQRDSPGMHVCMAACFTLLMYVHFSCFCRRLRSLLHLGAPSKILLLKIPHSATRAFVLLPQGLVSADREQQSWQQQQQQQHQSTLKMSQPRQQHTSIPTATTTATAALFPSASAAASPSVWLASRF